LSSSTVDDTRRAIRSPHRHLVRHEFKHVSGGSDRVIFHGGCADVSMKLSPIEANDTILAKQRRILQKYSFQFSENTRIIRHYGAFMKAIKIFIILNSI
jgi:hypothetical protein